MNDNSFTGFYGVDEFFKEFDQNKFELFYLKCLKLFKRFFKMNTKK
jgi:hypothetical protein